MMTKFREFLKKTLIASSVSTKAADNHTCKTVQTKLRDTQDCWFRNKTEEIQSFARLQVLTAILLQQGYRYPKLRKTFSKFYRRHYELISRYNVGLKTLLSEGLSEPEFYGDLVYKLKKLKGINDFSLQFGKIISRYRRIGYNLNVMRQSACLVFNPIMVDNYAAFFNCTPVGRASDSMMAPT